MKHLCLQTVKREQSDSWWQHRHRHWHTDRNTGSWSLATDWGGILRQVDREPRWEGLTLYGETCTHKQRAQRCTWHCSGTAASIIIRFQSLWARRVELGLWHRSTGLGWIELFKIYLDKISCASTNEFPRPTQAILGRDSLPSSKSQAVPVCESFKDLYLMFWTYGRVSLLADSDKIYCRY